MAKIREFLPVGQKLCKDSIKRTSLGKKKNKLQMNREPVRAFTKILAADDDPSILRLIKAVAEQEGYDVITARDGREALQLLFSDDLYAAAIFDIIMPHVQGIELVKYIQSDSRVSQVPIIIMTAEQGADLMAQSFASGAVAFLPKPFSIQQLRTMIRTFSR
jgi:DNA-binding response OmpR family regulator